MAKRRKPNRNPDHGKGLLKRLGDRPVNFAAKQVGQQEQYLLMNFEVTWDLMPDPEVKALPEAIRDQMEKIFDLIYQKPKSVIQELRDLVAIYPNVPCLTNWFISSLRSGSMAERREAMKLSKELFRDRPDYFFARTTLADLWLDEGQVENAAKLIFEPDNMLTRIYPARKVFHISEIRHWFYLSARIKIFLGEPKIAESYRDLLEEMEPGSRAVQHLNKMLKEKNLELLGLISGLKKRVHSEGDKTGS